MTFRGGEGPGMDEEPRSREPRKPPSDKVQIVNRVVGLLAWTFFLLMICFGIYLIWGPIC